MSVQQIDRVFVDGRYFSGGIAKQDLGMTKKRFQASARKVLADSGADHVVYCYIEYDAEGEITAANFYTGLKMDDAEFYKETGGLTGDYYVGAVHRLK